MARATGLEPAASGVTGHPKALIKLGSGRLFRVRTRLFSTEVARTLLVADAGRRSVLAVGERALVGGLTTPKIATPDPPFWCRRLSTCSGSREPLTPLASLTSCRRGAVWELCRHTADLYARLTIVCMSARMCTTRGCAWEYRLSPG